MQLDLQARQQLVSASLTIKLPGEKPAKKLGKHRKFLPVVDGEGKEKELLTNVMKKVLAENDFSGLDVNKAVRAHNVGESVKPSQKKIGGKKRADGAFKKGGSRKGMSPGGKPGGKSGLLFGEISPDLSESDESGSVPAKTGLCSVASRGDTGPNKSPGSLFTSPASSG